MVILSIILFIETLLFLVVVQGHYNVLLNHSKAIGYISEGGVDLTKIVEQSLQHQKKLEKDIRELQRKLDILSQQPREQL